MRRQRTTIHGLPWSTRPCILSSAASAPAAVGNCTNAWSLRRPLFISLSDTALVMQTLTKQRRHEVGESGNWGAIDEDRLAHIPLGQVGGCGLKYGLEVSQRHFPGKILDVQGVGRLPALVALEGRQVT